MDYINEKQCIAHKICDLLEGKDVGFILDVISIYLCGLSSCVGEKVDEDMTYIKNFILKQLDCTFKIYLQNKERDRKNDH